MMEKVLSVYIMLKGEDRPRPKQMRKYKYGLLRSRTYDLILDARTDAGNSFQVKFYGVYNEYDLKKWDSTMGAICSFFTGCSESTLDLFFNGLNKVSNFDITIYTKSTMEVYQDDPATHDKYIGWYRIEVDDWVYHIDGSGEFIEALRKKHVYFSHKLEHPRLAFFCKEITSRSLKKIAEIYNFTIKHDTAIKGKLHKTIQDYINKKELWDKIP